MAVETQPTPLHPELAKLLDRLRTRIRRYVLAEGAALVVVVMGLLFWLSLGIDWLYFSARTLELPVWFRKGFGILAACVFASSVGIWILLRTFRKARAKALALVLERRFPELNDRLVTAVELAESKSGGETELTQSMLRRTIDDVVEAAARIEVDEVFNRAPLRRAAVGALVLVVSIGAFAAMNNAAFARWQRAFISWEDEYWDRRTELVVKVIAQPGDRLREFIDAEYRHPRGSDLALLIEVPEGRDVPERVQLYYELDNNHGNARVPLSRFADRQFRHTITGLLDGLTLYVRGGDYTNRRPLRVNVVDPPRIDTVILQSDYPDYTGLDQPKGDDGITPRTPVPVQGTQASLPMGTNFILEAATNKSLLGVRVQTERLDIELNPQGGSLTILPAEGMPERKIALAAPGGEPFLTSGENRFRLPFVLVPDAPKQWADPDWRLPIPLPADGTLRMTLHDADDVISEEPSRLTLNAIIDQPPVIQSELQGVGTSITRKAVIPVKGVVTDDYGISKARFDFRVNNDEQWRVRPFRVSPDGFPKSFVLQREEGREVEQFEVLPLDLALGHKLTLTVYAQDGDNLTGPHTSRGEQYTFQIVSDEELLSLLYAREINLRRRFEQIITEVEGTQKDLILHRTRVEEGKALKARPAETDKAKDREMQLRELDTAVAVCAERALHQVRKNAGETAAVEDSFKAILEELVNNAVHTRQMTDRLEGLIVRPLSQINQADFPAVDQSLGLFKLANEKGDDPVPRIDASTEAVASMLAHMRAVLAEMEELVKFHEAVQQLKRIIEDEERIGDDTQNLRKKSRLQQLKDLE